MHNTGMLVSLRSASSDKGLLPYQECTRSTLGAPRSLERSGSLRNGGATVSSVSRRTPRPQLTISLWTKASTSPLVAGSSRSGTAAANSANAGQKNASAASRSFCASAQCQQSPSQAHALKPKPNPQLFPTVGLLHRQEHCASPRPDDRLLLRRSPGHSHSPPHLQHLEKPTAGGASTLRSLCSTSSARYCASYGALSGLGACRSAALAWPSHRPTFSAAAHAPPQPRPRAGAPRAGPRAALPSSGDCLVTCAIRSRIGSWVVIRWKNSRD